MNTTYYPFLIKEKARIEKDLIRSDCGEPAIQYLRMLLQRVETANMMSSEVEAWNHFRGL